MREQPLAQDQVILEADLLGDARARIAADQRRLDPRQLSLGIFGKAEVEGLANDAAQNGVTQELEPFVRLDAGSRH